MRNLPTHAALMIAVALALSGCSESPSVSPTSARAVKVEKVSSHNGSSATLVGVVRAANKTELSFVEPGLVDKVLVDVGQSVKRGQTLAVLERTVQAAALRSAEAERKAAQSALTAQERENQRQQALHQAGEASDATLASAKASLEAAVARRDSAATAESEARWKYNNAAIVAPFDGSVTARTIDPGATASSGQAVLAMENPTALQVVVDVPAGATDSLTAGEVLKATSTRTSTELEVKLVSISESVSGSGTAKAIFDVIGSVPLKSGEGVRVFIVGKSAAETTVPIQSLVFGDQQGKGEIFVFDADKLIVKKREVTYKADDSGKVHITSGVDAADWVVVAGASQLRDGQRAKPIAPLVDTAKGQAK